MHATAPCPRCQAPVLRVSRRCLACRLALRPAEAAVAREGPVLNRAALVLAFAVLSSLCVGTGGVVALLYPEARALRRRLGEERALEGLALIRTAQDEWRREHPHYGTLSDLGDLGVLDRELASGLRDGYAFAVEPLRVDPGQRWLAVANPLDGQGRAFAIDEQGAVVYRHSGLELDPEVGALPGDVQPLLR
ncbi:MAG: hypothetical protein KDD82_00575 [Planctomycetes bacterium]|nr:hypothetical protein [Planctomycetota bacterium]